MVASIQILRSLVRGNRPAGRLYGEPYVNFSENQFGIFDSGNTPRDLLGVPMFSTGQNYVAGNVVNNGGRLYIALVAVTAGVFNGTQWAPFYGQAQGPLINGLIVESHASNTATFAIKTFANTDPSATDQVGVVFADGSVLWIKAALSITIPAGYMLGAGIAANYPFRYWLGMINNAGTPVLTLRQNVDFTTNKFTIFGPASFGYATATAITAPGGAQTTYGNVAVGTLQPMRVLAHIDYENGLPTIGNWTVSPTRIVYAVPGEPIPGQIIQEFNNNSFAQTTTTSGASWQNSNVISNITPTSKVNIIRVQATMSTAFIATNASNYAQHRMLCTVGSRVVGPAASVSNYATYANQVVTETLSWDITDYPAVNTLAQYVLQSIISGVGTIYQSYGTFSFMRAQEIMA